MGTGTDMGGDDDDTGSTAVDDPGKDEGANMTELAVIIASACVGVLVVNGLICSAVCCFMCQRQKKSKQERPTPPAPDEATSPRLSIHGFELPERGPAPRPHEASDGSLQLHDEDPYDTPKSR